MVEIMEVIALQVDLELRRVLEFTEQEKELLIIWIRTISLTTRTFLNLFNKENTVQQKHKMVIK